MALAIYIYIYKGPLYVSIYSPPKEVNIRGPRGVSPGVYTPTESYTNFFEGENYSFSYSRFL